MLYKSIGQELTKVISTVDDGLGVGPGAGTISYFQATDGHQISFPARTQFVCENVVGVSIR